MADNYSISDDKSKLDIPFVQQYLSEESYWARGRRLEEVVRSVENSICFGVYGPDGKQVAFARVVTDTVVFAWLMDVFVTPSMRGKGIGRKLLSHIINHQALSEVKGIGLRTEDAHGLYRAFGFGEIPKPNTWMYRPGQPMPDKINEV